MRKTVVFRARCAICRPFSTPHHGDHHLTYTHAYTPPAVISSLIVSKPLDLSSVDSHSEEAAIPHCMAAFRSSHACILIHIPPADLAIQYAYNPSSTPFSSTVSGGERKGTYRSAFMVRVVLQISSLLFTCTASGTHAEQRHCAAPLNYREYCRECPPFISCGRISKCRRKRVYRNTLNCTCFQCCKM